MQSIKGFAKYAVSAAALKNAAKKRNIFSSKKENGRALIISGSSKYYGSSSLASNAAYNTLASLRIGAGYAKIFVPESILNVTRHLSPNMIVQPLGKNEITFNAKIKNEIEKADAIAIGMGIGRNKKAISSAERIISHANKMKKKIVVDADAIIALKNVAKKEKLNKNIAATPHDSEFALLSGTKLPTNMKKRIKIVNRVAKQLNITIISKGHYSIITDGKSIKITMPKNATLATMGTGDVLSGIISGYAATGASMLDSCVAGAYLHSIIGDKLYAKKGNHILATDVVDEIPTILKKFDK